MNVLLLIHGSEEYLIGDVYDALQEQSIDLQVVRYQLPYQGICSQQSEIFAQLANSDVLAYFSSAGNNQNSCLALAIREAARLNVKIVCIGSEDEEQLGDGFSGFGDCIVPVLADLPSVIIESNGDGLAEGARKTIQIKRFKCGNKE
ncbi:hypothetical protein [Pseudomonas sp. PSKL.D1]|uniref:hypothetical protein n=1 Tax=Pseudomonas sp. PSKL.D1 TaxID=3029060 RepID=UPI0023810DB2|nr:hypothetical protein [Pseudomonas sp. PSKL.D1]WDY56234.1 hypothetical protein PVV54_16680 [Pseudomonas sp. PSKL.D1]